MIAKEGKPRGLNIVFFATNKFKTAMSLHGFFLPSSSDGISIIFPE